MANAYTLVPPPPRPVAPTGEHPDRIDGVRCRDSRVLETIARETLPGLLRAARAAGLTLEEAEDAVQATFLTFCRRAEDFDGRARAGTWLFGILIRKIAERRRAHVREARSEDIDAVVESRFDATGRWSKPPQGPEFDLLRDDFRGCLGDCLEQVPERQRLAFVLREVEGLSTEEICKVFGVSANNLGVLLFRARNRLRECLERKGYTGSSDVV